jgi:GT2 family glycosyltransferase
MPGSVDAEGQYLGCNMGFKKEVFDIAGLYSTKFGYHEDRDFALRVLKNGKIIKNNDMITTHQQKLWTIKSYLNSSRRAAERILLFKYYDDISLIKFRILFPKNLLKIFFPPLILITLLKQKNKTVLDYKIILVSYWYYIRQRYYIWRTAWKEGVFLL